MEKESEKKKEEQKSEQEKSSMFREGNISLILDSYDDIFSDFDPRPYSERALSDDFLLECRKASRDKPSDGTELELRLLVPEKKRDINNEAKIKKRLKSHFQKHYGEKRREQGIMRNQGFVIFLIGILLLLTGTLVYDYPGFLFKLMLVVFEPAGWFSMWVGLEKIFLSMEGKQPEIGFYRKMANMKVLFFSY